MSKSTPKGKPATRRVHYGLGLRPPYYAAACCGDLPVDWLELISENFMVPGGKPCAVLRQVRDHYPVAFHGVSMNLGGTDPLDRDYLSRLRNLASDTEPMWISDHLCWTRQGGHHLHDLLPLPYSDEVINHVAGRISQAQDFLGRRILIENLSSYAEFDWSPMLEWQFLTAVAEAADCLILLDINNIIVSAHNHGFAAADYLQAIPVDRVAQFHLAGHSDSGGLKIDSHDQPVPDEVWQLFRAASARFGRVPLCLERDDHIPPVAQLLDELARAKEIFAEAAIQ